MASPIIKNNNNNMNKPKELLRKYDNDEYTYMDHPILVEKITPERAARMLSLDKRMRELAENRNRPISRNWVNIYSYEMTEDRWVLNGASISITPEGIVIDGQHRLNAVVATGVTIWAYVYRNAKLTDPDSIGHLNPRRLSDALGSGENWISNPTDAAAVVNAYVTILDEQDGRPRRRIKPSHIEGKAMWHNTPDLFESMTFCAQSGYKKFHIYKPAKMVACHVMFARAGGREMADDFIEKLISGSGIKIGDPVYALREKLIKLDRETMYLKLKYRTGATLDILDYNYMIYTWNKMREGSRVDYIRLGNDKSTKMLKIK